jgi:hypothetical protein
MSTNLLDDRRRAWEEAFFAKHNEALRRRLMDTETTAARRKALSAASGITDDAVLDTLISLDIHSDTLAALSLVPLVAVAWADGSIDDKERAALLSRAAEAGLGEQGASYEMLDRWLAQRPPAGLLATWKAYIAALSVTLTPEAKLALKSKILGRSRAIAEAAGGFLGLGRKASIAEEQVLRQLNEALS